MVRFPLGGAHRCGSGRAGPLHQPQALEGVVVDALLGEEALRGVQQQQALPDGDERRESSRAALTRRRHYPKCHTPAARRLIGSQESRETMM